MLIAIDPPHKTETKNSLPGSLLSSDIEVPLSNLIKEDVMEMIDPEDPQPLSSNESKSRPLNPPTTRKQRTLVDLLETIWETIVAVSCLLFGFAMLCNYIFIIPDNDPLQDTLIYAILLIGWESLVMINTWYYQFLFVCKYIFQVLILGILTCTSKDIDYLMCLMYGILLIVYIVYIIINPKVNPESM